MTEWLQQALKSTSPSQAALARHLKVDPSLISHWMAKRQVPSTHNFSDMLALFAEKNPGEFTPEKEIIAWRLLAEAARAHSCAQAA